MISRTSVTRRQIQQEIFHHDRRVKQARRALDEAKIKTEDAKSNFKLSLLGVVGAWLLAMTYILS